MFGLIALAAVCGTISGAFYLAIRKPADASVERADPALWPYRHY
jgi:hypothetical protein